MRSDLAALMISNVAELTGVSIPRPRALGHWQRWGAIASFVLSFGTIAYTTIPPLQMPLLLFLGGLVVGFICLEIGLVEGALLGLGLAILSLGYGISQTISRFILELGLSMIVAAGLTLACILLWRYAGLPRLSKTLRALYGEVDRYHRTLEQLDVFDQLIDAGNPLPRHGREQAIAALALMRQELIRALKTERILRENPSFRPEYFAIDLQTLQPLDDRAVEYGQIFAATLEIAAEVQATMQALQREYPLAP
ncbi:MAG: hypothetical protein HC919_02410 [Oscillatoriales cyanobacterium SM2_2_1]|nr:hypothetical protein [Oscillatoriales cyanobacterium SM2_2_1]